MISFELDTVGELLTRLRIDKEYETLDQKYAQFRDMGIRSGQAEHAMALAAFVRKDYAKGLEAIERALEVEPDNRVFKMNKALFLVACGRGADAGEIFAMIPVKEGESELYKAARAMADYARFQLGSADVDRSHLIDSLMQVRTSRSLHWLGIRPFDVTVALMRTR